MFARGVIKFELNTAPDPKTIKQVFLSLFFINGSPSIPGPNDLCSLYTVKCDWHEMETTWKLADNATKWQQLDANVQIVDPETGEVKQFPGGGDRNALVTTTQCVAKERWELYEVTESIIKMINGTESNYGFHLKPNLLPAKLPFAGGRSYASSNSTRVHERPQLIFIYEKVSEMQAIKNGASVSRLRIQKFGHDIFISIPHNPFSSLQVFDLQGVMLLNLAMKTPKAFFIPNTLLPSGAYILKNNERRNLWIGKIILK